MVSCNDADEGSVWFVSWEEPSLRAFANVGDLADRLRIRTTSGAYRVDRAGRFEHDIELLRRIEERPLPHVW